MKVKVNEAQCLVLDWMVTKTIPGLHEGQLNPLAFRKSHDEHDFKYSTEWSQGGPVIEREMIDVCAYRSAWRAARYVGTEPTYGHGSTPLIAAMRCYVASKLGEEIEVPVELA